MTLISVMYGLVSALTWGAGDFSGGMAVKRSNPYGVVMFAHAISLTLVVALALILGEPVPPARDFLWGAAAGLGGGIGLALLYTALASGQMSVAAPVSALVAAALPVLVGAYSEGWLSPTTMTGFALAFIAVWFISGGAGLKLEWDKLAMPVVAGMCFGAFFVFLDQGSGVSMLYPLAATRVASITSLLIFSAATRQPILPARESWTPIVLSSVLDTAGNAFYVLSAQTGRMDVAAVLGSLYPGSTVVLASLVLKEKISRPQMVGIAAALIAIALITL